MREQNEKLGTWICGQGGEAEVYQTKKLGRHFYTRCECCGLNQGTGAARQQRIFDEAVFFNPSSVVIPSNVKMGAVVSEVPGKKPAPVELDFNPNEPAENIEVEKPVRTGFGASKLWAGLVMIAAAGVGVWMN